MTYSNEEHFTRMGEDFLKHYGVKGMRWGVTSEQVAREKSDGVKYQKSTFNASKKDTSGPIKKHYSDNEIRDARQIQEGKRAAIKALDDKYGKDPVTKKYIFTREHERAYANLLDSRERVIANRKTRGEKIAATLLAGPFGAYYASDRHSQSRY